MKKKLLYSLLFGMFSLSSAFGADYGLPSGIQQGNILHCFNWKFSDITAALPSIAEAGFGAIQVSPVQGNCGVGAEWFYAYMPYDFVFKANGNGTRQQLQTLCDKAAEYGIKIIVDVVANHVNQAAGYHDTWWDSNGRVRWNGGCDYNNRYSITHNQLGEYGDVNSEAAEVQARAKAFITDLKSLGVKGIRWDAAKHIALPSESCNFWSEMASVAGLWHYGEILDGPGGDKYKLLKEYTQYIGVTDSEYSKWTLNEIESGRVPSGSGSWTANGVNGAAVVLWAESHDDYSNDGQYGKNTALVSQDKIDRAWAITACRKNETSLYFSRPSKTRRVEIKMGEKGSTNFTSKHIAEVNKFRNTMVGKEEYYSHSGSVACVTRKDGGAVIVNANGSGNISISNGGGYCPAGTYKDRVSGGTFTVTASTISGNVGSSGIAVLVADGITPPDPGPGPNPNPDPDPDPEGDMWILGNLEGAAGWAATPGTGAAMTLSNGKYVANGVKMVAAEGETTCYFNLTDYVGATWDDLNMGANRYGAATEGEPITLGTPATVVKYANQVDASGCLSWTVPAGTYDFTFDPSAMTLTVVNAGDNPNPGPTPDPDPQPGVLTITGDYNLAYSGSLEKVYYWGSGVTAPAWPGVAMQTAKGSDGKTYKVYKVPAGTTGIIFATQGDADKTKDLTYTNAFVMDNNGATSTAVKFEGASPDPGPGPQPDPDPAGDHYIYYDGTFSTPYVWAWDGATNCTDSGKWPGDAMTKKDGMWYWELPAGKVLPHNVIISENGGEKIGGGDLDYEDKATYHQDGTHTASGPVVEKPVVTANPAGGTTFTTDNITVTLTVSPAADIYYTLDGSAPSTSSTKYTAPIVLTANTTIKTLAITAEGGKSTQSFKYTKRNNNDPIPGPSGKNLITDYYLVNPNGQVGSNRTVSMSFTGQKSNTALSNWKAEDLIAQGVARDVCQAFKGTHERPLIDSYALYAAYDSQNLYLGVQYVYAVWDLYGEGYQPGESKPYNMDGKLCIAFDLDPELDAKGITNENSSIWFDKIYTTFNNGSDAWWYGSTKPGVGTPGFFVPNADGICDYSDPNSCKPSSVKYGYADGLLPSITAVYGQPEFGYDPSLLEGNAGFVDLRGMSVGSDRLEDSAHTFYEYTFPLSMLGITEDYIRNEGIGVMICDIYGSSAHSSLPYDPCFYDKVFESFSQDPSSSAEKEDQNEVTYAHARIGKIGNTSAVVLPSVDASADAEPQYFTLQGVRVAKPSNGLYIVVRGNKATKEFIR